MLNSIVTTDYLSQSIMTDIRQGLLQQDNFQKFLGKHKGSAKRYLYRTNMSSYTTIDFGIYDVYAVYINDRKQWVVRLGIYPDKNAEVFFSNQIGGVVGTLLSGAVRLLNLSLNNGWISPVLYHVTDSPESSFISSSYEPVKGLVGNL